MQKHKDWTYLENTINKQFMDDDEYADYIPTISEYDLLHGHCPDVAYCINQRLNEACIPNYVEQAAIMGSISFAHEYVVVPKAFGENNAYIDIRGIFDKKTEMLKEFDEFETNTGLPKNPEKTGIIYRGDNVLPKWAYGDDEEQDAAIEFANLLIDENKEICNFIKQMKQRSLSESDLEDIAAIKEKCKQATEKYREREDAYNKEHHFLQHTMQPDQPEEIPF